MVITSVSNEKVKAVRKLAQKKYRDAENAFILEGIKPVREAIAQNRDIVFLFGTESALLRIGNYAGERVAVSESVYASVSEERNPEGVLAVVEKPSMKPQKCNARCLLLDGVRDPGNLGTIIRTAAAAGYRHVFLKECADPYNPKTVRASMSGIFGVTLYEALDDFASYIEVPIYAADMNGEDVFGTEKRDVCIALGGEADGLSDAVRAAAEKIVSIPMEQASESLNVAVAAGIMMYALR